MSNTRDDGCARFEAPVWAGLAFLCLAAAILQWVALADRLSHLAWFVFKFGIELPLLTAGSFMIFVFFTATSIFACLGAIATIQLRKAGSGLRICSSVGVVGLLAGALVWGGLLASPLVRIVFR